MTSTAFKIKDIRKSEEYLFTQIIFDISLCKIICLAYFF